MNISEHAKKQAMEVVANREFMQHVRMMDLGPEPTFTNREDYWRDPKPYQPISENVKRQAMEAVSDRETRQQIKLMDLGPEPDFIDRQNKWPVIKPYEPITDDMKRQAMNAVSHYETAQIRQLEMTEDIRPMYTPTFHSKTMADRVNEMHREGLQPWQIQNELTKDDFGREI